MSIVEVEFEVEAATAQGAVDIVERLLPDLRVCGIDPNVVQSWQVARVRKMVPIVMRVEDGVVQTGD